MEFVTLEIGEFEEFVKTHENKSYFQSEAVINLRAKSGWSHHIVGVRENGKIIAGSIVFSKKRHMKDEFYALRGPLLDFRNEELVRFFFSNLRKYVKEHNGFMLRIDPYVELTSFDKDFKKTNLFDNSKYVRLLHDIGFDEIKSKEMVDYVQAKTMYVIDLGEKLEDTMKDMESKTRQMIRKNEKNGVVLRHGSIDDIDSFADIMSKTSERRNFVDRGKTFYKNMYECLIKDKMVSLEFADLDINLALENINKEREELEKAKMQRLKKMESGNFNEAKMKAREKEECDALARLEKREKEFLELKEKHGERITLGGILYIHYGDEVASLAGGCYEEFKEFQAFYTLHYEMIKYAIEHNYKRYNFYGMNNYVEKENNSQYGIYQFKRSFGGHVIQFIGEFILPVDKVLYTLYKIKNKIAH